MEATVQSKSNRRTSMISRRKRGMVIGMYKKVEVTLPISGEQKSSSHKADQLGKQRSAHDDDQ
jgi:hypothetical protein